MATTKAYLIRIDEEARAKMDKAWFNRPDIAFSKFIEGCVRWAATWSDKEVAYFLSHWCDMKLLSPDGALPPSEFAKKLRQEQKKAQAAVAS